jgi:MOSC domain-containing protein YiiM
VEGYPPSAMMAACIGKVRRHIAPKASAPMDALLEAPYRSSGDIDRQAMIEVETLEALARDRSVELAPHEHRPNLTTRGVPLNHLVGQYFRIGDCVLYGGRLNVPCLHLENLT